MTHYEPATTKALPRAVDALGVDGDGRTHFATPATHGPITIYVETGDGYDVFQLSELPCDSLEGWIDHVGTLRGWGRLCYNDSFADVLAHSIEVSSQ